MKRLREFEKEWTPAQAGIMRSLKTPAGIQAYLDSIIYSNNEDYYGPLTLMDRAEGSCMEGALFAAAALRRLGHRPLIMELFAERDDEHVIALYRKDGLWGSLAKSNYPGLRSRQPVYRTLRELALSYFELYYNLAAEHTLRGYTAALDLTRFDRLHWMVKDDGIHRIARALDHGRHFKLFPVSVALALRPMDPWLFKAAMTGTDVKKAFDPHRRQQKRRAP